MSRTRAAGKSKWKNGKRVIIQKGEINWEETRSRLYQQNKIEIRGAGADEAPEVYKNLKTVLNAHKNTIKIIHTLKPIGVAMASENIQDPYKD